MLLGNNDQLVVFMISLTQAIKSMSINIAFCHESVPYWPSTELRAKEQIVPLAVYKKSPGFFFFFKSKPHVVEKFLHLAAIFTCNSRPTHSLYDLVEWYLIK